MHWITFLQDLAVVMILAGLVAVIFNRLKQPVVLGYLLVGIIIGPHTPPASLITDPDTIHTLAELGLVFLMFSLGLEFSFRKLREVGATAFIAASFEIVLMIWLGYEMGILFGWNAMDSLFLGAMLSISSTTIIVKAFRDQGKIKETSSQITFGILIVEDLLGIALIALLSSLALTGSLDAKGVALSLGKLGAFMAALLVFGFLIVPRFLAYVGKFKSNEILLITVLGLCFGVSLLAMKLEYSVALGAFMIGAIVAEAREVGKIEHLMEPIRDMFSAVFFVAIGLLIDPAILIEYALPILLITVVVVIGKVLTCATGTFLAGHSIQNSLRVGMGLAQIGEFSFIIASLGLSLKVTSGFLYPIAVSVSVITTFLTPYLIRHSDKVSSLLENKLSPKSTRALQIYSHWIQNLSTRRAKSRLRKGLRKMIFRLSIKLALIASVFFVAIYIEHQAPAWLPQVPQSLGGTRALLWFAAMILATPIYIAALLNLRNLGTLISKISVPAGAGGQQRDGNRTLISNIVFLTGIFGLSFFTIILSSAILPQRNVLIVLLCIVAVLMVLFWNRFVKLYSKAQVQIEQLLSEPKDHVSEIAPVSQSAFPELNLQTVIIRKGTAVAQKLIREVELRKRTGVSVVGIQRQNETVINPDADQEFQIGDQVLLLGSSAQLQQAKKLFE